MSPKNIVAVTFTNKAAREMKSRLTQLLDGKQLRGITISTFHSLGLDIIRKEYKAVGLKSNFSLFDDYDTNTLLKELMQKNGDSELAPDAVKHQISLWKSQLLSPEDASMQAATPLEKLSGLVFGEYQKHLRAYNAIDFDDLIRIPSLLLRTNPDILEKWQNKIHYLLVDEYQDTNGSQYELIKLLMRGRGRLTVVGDDDQSIYAWRGAQPENLSLLKEDFPNLEVIMLEQNYRSTGHIIHAANTLIANNPHIFTKNLWSQLGPGEPIIICPKQTEDKEAEWVAQEIMTKKLRKSCSYGDFAVLYRSHYQSRLLEMKLQALQIPYKISGGTSFFSRTEIKDILAYLRLVINPDDDNAYLRIINTPRREIGATTLEKLGQYAQSRNQSLLSSSDEMGLMEHLPEKTRAKLSQFSQWMQQCAREVYDATTVGPIKKMIEAIQYGDWLNEQSSSPKAAEKRMENVNYLLTSIEKLLENNEAVKSSESPLEKAITQLIIRDMIEQQTEEQQTDQVQLMTLHAAKGLEFPHVYLIGSEEEILPHRNSIENGDIEEERRLMYVGITRAQRSLTISYCNQRKMHGEKVECSFSRFLEELPEEAIEWEKSSDVKRSREEQEVIAGAHLADLRKMLEN